MRDMRSSSHARAGREPRAAPGPARVSGDSRANAVRQTGCMNSHPQRSFRSAADGSSATSFMWWVVFLLIGALSGIVSSLASAQLALVTDHQETLGVVLWVSLIVCGVCGVGAFAAFVRTFYVLLDRSDRRWSGE